MLSRDNNIVIKYNKKTVIGLSEEVIIFGPKNKKKKVMARIDTGATKSSIDIQLAADLALGPILKAALIRSASGTGLRPVVESRIEFADKDITAEFSLADRSHMKFPVLIGQNILKEGFLVDPAKKTEE